MSVIIASALKGIVVALFIILFLEGSERIPSLRLFSVRRFAEVFRSLFAHSKNR
jgi:hypothetical protein